MVNEWGSVCLGDLITHQKGFAFKSTDYRRSGHPIVRVSNFTERSIDMENCVYIREGSIDAYISYAINYRDVVVATVGSWPTNPASVVGKTICVPKHASDALLNQNAVRLRAKHNFNQLFLFYLLKGSSFQKYIVACAQGSASQASITLKDIFSFQFECPSLPEQEAISAVLSALDDKIELNRRMNVTLEAMARAIFRDWFVDFGPTRAKMEGRAPYLASDVWALFPDRLDDEGRPDGWRGVEVSRCCSSIYSGGTPATSVSAYWDGNIPWLSSGETRNLVVTSTERQISKAGVAGSSTRLARKGATVIASAGQGNTRGQASWLGIDAYVNQSVIAAAADTETVSDAYLFFDLSRRYEEFRRISDSNSSRGSLTTKMISGLSTILPTDNLVDAFDAVAGPILSRIAANAVERETMASLRDLLLPKLMSGEIRVREAEKIAEAAA